MQAPEAYLGNAGKLFDGDNLTDESTKKFLQTYIDAFATWVERHAD